MLRGLSSIHRFLEIRLELHSSYMNFLSPGLVFWRLGLSTKTFKMQPSEIQTTAEEKIRMVERQYEKYALDSNAEVAKNHENIDTWNRIENIVYKMMSKSQNKINSG